MNWVKVEADNAAIDRKNLARTDVSFYTDPKYLGGFFFDSVLADHQSILDTTPLHWQFVNKLTRRDLIRFLAALAAYVPASLLLAAPTGETTRKVSIRALGPFLDTLLPEDGTPSATQLGVDKEIVKRMRNNKRFVKILILGCAWLDQQARKLGAEEFALLEAPQQESIVTTAENSASRSLPLVFFSTTQQLAFQHYYAHPESWRDLGYAGPPQPKGFLDFAGPPT